ncbi:MAG TPA: HAD-IA family hydrolase [Candidatus Dormibacteraeota bacterium]|nr:HAD-IA family hydrolase [Candidatus Dormibacteraeota bacterium]
MKEDTVGFRGAIFDVDGVLVDSPHQRAWREALQELMEREWSDLQGRTTYRPERFTAAVYQTVMAGKPRLDGARAALEYFEVPDAARRAEAYGERKQRRVMELIEAGAFHAFPDALRFLLALKGRGLRIAAASSSRNAGLFLSRIRLDVFAAERGLSYDFIRPGLTLQGALDADTSGRDLPRGKPDPTIFLVAAAELGLPPGRCFVVEDAAAGVQAAKAGGMAALGVARMHDESSLEQAGADLVVTTLDEVAVDALERGRLERASMR